jgi:hypothetical protein
MHTLKKVFNSVIANPHDGLTGADRLLRASLFTSLSRTDLHNNFTEQIAPVPPSRSFRNN